MFLATCDVVRSPSRVGLRSGHLIGKPLFKIFGRSAAGVDPVDQLLHENATPTAARTGALAIAQLTGQTHFVDANVVDDFTPRNMKAHA